MVAGGLDALGRRKRIFPTSTGKRVIPQDRDLLWFSRLAEHGPLPTSFLLAYGADTHKSEKRARERLTDLFNEADTPHGGPYLTRPPQQFRTIDSRYNQLVYDLAPAGWKALHKSELAPKVALTRSGPWLHRFMVGCITSSIEIGTLTRKDLLYISNSAIAARAAARDSCQAPIGALPHAPLQPDGLFGLQYTENGNRLFRFFAVEADRATEPMTSPNKSRKSIHQNFMKYLAYIESGTYRVQIGVTAPLLVLYIFSNQLRLSNAVRLLAEIRPQGSAYMLLSAWDMLGPLFRPPFPNPAFLSSWQRAGFPPIQIHSPTSGGEGAQWQKPGSYA